VLGYELGFFLFRIEADGCFSVNIVANMHSKDNIKTDLTNVKC